MAYIHTELTAQRFPNCTSVAARFEVTSKTIQRDFDFMRDRLQMPIAYEPARRGYFYSHPTEGPPTWQMTAEERTVLLIACHSLGQYGESLWTPDLRDIVSKISAQAAHGQSHLSTPVSFHTRAKPRVNPKTFREVCDAVISQCEIRVRHSPGEAEIPESTLMQPYHLSCVDGVWHVFGLDADHEASRVFRLDLLLAVEPTGKRFERQSTFVADLHLR